jgi:diphosphomevalonate decarboxylase
MNNSKIVLITPDDEMIGTIDKVSAHKYAMLHRAFSVIIYRHVEGQIEMLLQQRQMDKYHCGGLWTNSCCSHPAPTETVIQSANRRLEEEMGIIAELEEIGHFHYVAAFDNGLFENELDYVLIGTYYGTKIPFNNKEVNSVKWITIPNLLAWIKKEPTAFTPWFEKTLTFFLKRVEHHPNKSC